MASSYPASFVMKRKAFWHRGQTQRMGDKLFTQTGCRLGIIFRDKLHDLFEVSERAVGDQDSEVHPGIMPLNSSMGRVRPASTSFKPRSKAAFNSTSSGSPFIANSSTARSALSCAFKCAIAVFISWSVLISSLVAMIAVAVPVFKVCGSPKPRVEAAIILESNRGYAASHK